MVKHGRTSATIELPLRLAMRSEGGNWNTYIAQSDTMEDATLVGSINLAFVQRDDRKEMYITFMRAALADVIEGLTGERPTTDTRDAPEHERTRE